METTTQQSAIINEMLEPLTAALTPETAQLMANLKAKPSVERRVNALAEKCNEGTLSEAEQSEYEAYVRIGNVINILKARAKQTLSQKP